MWQRQSRRLRVVDEDEVVGLGQFPGVGRDAFPVAVLHLERPRDLRALQRVVHRLRDREELVAPLEERPFHLEAEVVQERDVRVEQLRDAAPVGRRVDLEHARARERPCRLTESLDAVGAGVLGVVREVPRRDGDDGEHRPNVSTARDSDVR